MTTENYTLRNKKFTVDNRDIPESKLLFYTENPRVYSILNKSGIEPSQDAIYDQMSKMDHVKTLKSSIESNGGIIDPLLVKDNGNDTYTVLEGNSRLAAIRLICEVKKDLAKWGMVKCKVFPVEFSDDEIFALLGQYHIIGRKDWDAYEQASYLCRRHKSTQLPIQFMANELGITVGSVKKMIQTIEFMHNHHDEDKKHFSYYNDNYLKNKSVQKYRETYPELDDQIVSMIKENKITEAKDLRKLSDIAKCDDKQSKRLIRDIAEGKMDIYEVYDRVEQSGKLGHCIQQFRKFREYINRPEIIDEINSSQEIYKKANFEINKIISRLENIKKKIDK